MVSAAIPYDAFVADIALLADAIAAAGWRPDHLVGIGRGGLVPGAYLSHLTGIPLLSLDLSAGVPAFADGLVAELAALTGQGRRLLLVDDINDSGRTILGLMAALDAADADCGRVRVAVLIDNRRSPARADYRARTIDRATDRRWFVFPWEQVAPATAPNPGATGTRP